MMQIPDSLLAAFPPSADLLLKRVRRKTDDAMLHVIANADYGWEAHEMMRELRPIRDTGIVPSRPSFMLCEVLRLTMYSDPEVPNSPPFEPGPTGIRGHQTRLFACAVLLRMDDDVADSALAQGLVSAGVLGEAMSEAVGSYLTWKMTHEEANSETWLFAFGLLVLAARLRRGRFSVSGVGEIARWVFALESVNRANFPRGSAFWRPRPFSVQSGFWRPLVDELRTAAKSIRDEDVRTDLQLCALLLDVDG